MLDVSSQLGVRIKTLQRLVLKATNRTPTYWLLLARVRKAVKELPLSISLAELAYKHGYSDQAHLSREFKCWFAMSPSVLRSSPDVLEQLSAQGYD